MDSVALTRYETSANSRDFAICFAMRTTSIPSASRPPPKTPHTAWMASTAGAGRFSRRSANDMATSLDSW